jgi:hypothetical protein
LEKRETQPSTAASKNELVVCPGCSVQLPNRNLETTHRYNATQECWLLFGELSAYHYSRNDSTFIHQLAVDAYGAQHTGEQTPNITTAFALIGLYLSIEKLYTGIQVQQTHMILAQKKIVWPRLEVPNRLEAMTVQDVLQVSTDQRDIQLCEWAKSIWAAWDKEKDWVSGIVENLLPYLPR